MSAPPDIKLAAPRRTRRAAKVQLAPPAELTETEIRVALAFRQFRTDMQGPWLDALESVAEKCKLEAAAAQPARVLKLVSGGAQ